MLIFFFKQKTAYEMRISDWSSDVCSSDLHGRQSCHLEAAARCGRVAEGTWGPGLSGAAYGQWRRADWRAGFRDADLRSGLVARAGGRWSRNGRKRADRKSTRLNSSH